MTGLRERLKYLRDIRAIRTSGAFNDSYYRSQLANSAATTNALRHYFEFGESAGLRPTPEFDPRHYAAQNPDVLQQGGNLFLHFLRHGKSEGRSGAAAPPLEQLPVWPDNLQDVVLLLVHEMSRTGAPILGWNIARGLRQLGRRVVVVALGGGELRGDFASAADYLVEIANDGGEPGRILAAALAKRFQPAYAICNSGMTAPFGQHLEAAGVPVVGLIHEFGTFIRYISRIEDALADWSALVFPANVVRQSVAEAVPALELRSVNILPQGKSSIPSQAQATMRSAPLPHLRDGYDFVVLGAGSVDFRKGIDLFVAAAAATKRKAPELRVRFIWIGGKRGDASDYREYLKEQIARSDIDDRFQMFDSTDRLEAVYRSVDAMFLSSRLDPLPNVSIDAASMSLPVVCFDGASGMAEIMSTDPVCSRMIVPYTDASAAADAILGLARDAAWSKRAGDAMGSLAHRTFDMAAYVGKLDSLGQGFRSRPTIKQAAE